MKNFEEQLAQSAARLRNAENRRLQVPRPIHKSRRIPWGWIATPVAALVGLFWGVELGRMSTEVSSSLETKRVTDTVVRYDVLRDTVYLSHPSGAMASVSMSEPRNKALRARRVASPTAHDSVKSRTAVSPRSRRTGKCILEDGVDYTLLQEAVFINR